MEVGNCGAGSGGVPVGQLPRILEVAECRLRLRQGPPRIRKLNAEPLQLRRRVLPAGAGGLPGGREELFNRR